jgi:hypothetical protein
MPNLQMQDLQIMPVTNLSKIGVDVYILSPQAPGKRGLLHDQAVGYCRNLPLSLTHISGTKRREHGFADAKDSQTIT